MRLPRKLHRDSLVYTYDFEQCPKKHPFYCFALSLRLFTSSFIKFCLIKENRSELSAAVAVVCKWAQSSLSVRSAGRVWVNSEPEAARGHHATSVSYSDSQ